MRNRRRAGTGTPGNDLTRRLKPARFLATTGLFAVVLAGCAPEAPSPEALLLEVLDTDHDGWLSQAEFERLAHPDTRFAEIDTDQDRRVDQGELRVLLETQSPVLPR